MAGRVGDAGFRLNALGKTFAAEVSEIDLSDPLDNAVFAALTDALFEHHVLVFHGQSLQPDAFRALALRFGMLQPHALRNYRHKEFPDLSWLTNVKADGSVDSFGVRRATTWHTDATSRTNPPAMAMLYAFEVPESGGGTLFADMEAAFAALPADQRERLSGLTGLHRYAAGPGGAMYRNVLDADQDEDRVDSRHPAVLPHPHTGRPILYVNSIHTRGFDGMSDEEGYAIVEELMIHATRPEFLYRHDWRVGDLVMWDEYGTMHRSAGDYRPEQRRVMLRALVCDNAVQALQPAV